jgi:ubiquinone biosynthesis protein
MLVAEGVGRILDPRVNMWELARPLIETWMRANLGPEARVKDVARTVAGSIERLPRLLHQTEKTYSMLVSGGLKLHPDTVKDLASARRRGGFFPPWLPWLLAAVLAFMLLRR